MKALWKVWWASMGSAVFTILSAYTAIIHKGESWLLTVTIMLALALLAIASYRTWREQRVARTAGFAVRVFSPRHGAIKFVRADRRAFSRGPRSNRSVSFVPARSCRRIRCSLTTANLPGG